MRKLNRNQKGFTLVELAIVMTIIGLLIGGVLKGQQLLENARMTATIAQIKGFEAAATSFRDTYGSLPGDLANADTRLPECGGCAINLAGNDLLDDGRVDDVWAFDSGITATKVQFFGHMMKADLITGVTDAAATGETGQGINKSVPEARSGGAFMVGYLDNNTLLGGSSITGHTLSIIDQPNATANATSNIKASRAGQIDRKLDDSRSDTGFIQGNQTGNCAQADSTDATIMLYRESETAKTCAIAIRIMG